MRTPYGAVVKLRLWTRAELHFVAEEHLQTCGLLGLLLLGAEFLSTGWWCSRHRCSSDRGGFWFLFASEHLSASKILLVCPRGFRHQLLGVASRGSVPCQSEVFSSVQLPLKLGEKRAAEQLHWAAGRCALMLLSPYFFSFILWGISWVASEIGDWAIRSFASLRVMEASVWLEHLWAPCKLLNLNVWVSVSSWVLSKLHWWLNIFHFTYMQRGGAFLVVRIEGKKKISMKSFG